MAPGSDLHVALAVQHSLCAERVLGELLAAPPVKFSKQQGASAEELNAGRKAGDVEELVQEEGEGLAWAKRALAAAERAAYDAHAAR